MLVVVISFCDCVGVGIVGFGDGGVVFGEKSPGKGARSDFDPSVTP